MTPSSLDVGGRWHDGDMFFPVPSAPMVGRDAELQRLLDAFAHAAQGESGAMLVAGEAGIGKTRLLREFEGRVGAKARVVTGWCVDYGATPAAYGPLPGILRVLISAIGESERVVPGLDILPLLLPELGETPPGLRETTSPERLREAIATVIETAAELSPLVLLIEDLHWADEATLSTLTFLLRVVTHSRVLFVLSCRTDEVHRGGPVSSFLAGAERARVLERLTISRLDPEATRQLLQGLGRTHDDAALLRMQERAEGVPFFIEELAGCASAPMPDTLRDLLLARFDGMSDEAKRVTRFVSGGESGISHALLAPLAHLSDEALDDAVREAVAAGFLVVRDREGYGFRHALLREAVHDDLLPGERARLHRAIAEALDASATPDERERMHAALAFHWHLANDHRRALIAAVGAMEQSKQSYAFATAARFGELALELWDQVPDAPEAAGRDRVTLLLRLGSILRNAGDGERALTVVDLALDEIDPVTGDGTTYVRLLRDKAYYLGNLGRPGAIDLLVDALAVLTERVHDDRLHASVLNSLASRYMVAGRSHEGLMAADKAFAFAERCGSLREMSVARNLRGGCLAHLGELDRAFVDYADAYEYARGDDNGMLRYRVNFSDLMIVLGRYREAIDVAQAGIVRSRELGVERTTGAIMTQNMAEPLLELGEIDRVEALVAHDLVIPTLPVFRIYTTKTRIRALAWRGHVDEGEALLREWRPRFAAAARIDRQVWYYDLESAIALEIARGDWLAAWAIVQSMLDDDGPVLGNRRRVMLDAAWVITALRASGVDVAANVAALDAAWQAIPEALRGDRWSRILEALLVPGASALDEAIALSASDEVPAVFRVITRLERARMLVADGDRAAATATLVEAEVLAEGLAHVRLTADVQELAARAGLGGGDLPHDPDLTGREAQVLDLLIEGLSNRQIGERLFISAKTVSVHVSAILRKLGVTTRTEAAVAAARRGAD